VGPAADRLALLRQHWKYRYMDPLKTRWKTHPLIYAWWNEEKEELRPRRGSGLTGLAGKRWGKFWYLLSGEHKHADENLGFPTYQAKESNNYGAWLSCTKSRYWFVIRIREQQLALVLAFTRDSYFFVGSLAFFNCLFESVSSISCREIRP